MYSLSDFDFELPETLIAQHPLEKRSASKLLVVHDEQLADSHFDHLIDYLDKDDLLVFNNTKVLKARFFGTKATGGKIEILIERILDSRTALAKVRASKSPKDNSTLFIDGQLEVTVQGRQDEFYILHFRSDIFAILEQYGHLPLPPYIERAADAYDETRYQTVFAREPGAVAAPTAGLHFDEELLDRLGQKGVRKAYRPCTLAQARSSRSEAKICRNTRCTPSGTPSRRKPLMPSGPRKPPGGKLLPSGPPACVRWNPLPEQDNSLPEAMKQTCSSHRATASGPSIIWSPIFICRNRHC